MEANVEQSICNLLAKWKRESIETSSIESKRTLEKCIFALQGLLLTFQEEEDYMNYFFGELPSKEAEEYLLSQQADDQLSTLEEHENIA